MTEKKLNLEFAEISLESIKKELISYGVNCNCGTGNCNCNCGTGNCNCTGNNKICPITNEVCTLPSCIGCPHNPGNTNCTGGTNCNCGTGNCNCSSVNCNCGTGNCNCFC